MPWNQHEEAELTKMPFDHQNHQGTVQCDPPEREDCSSRASNTDGSCSSPRTSSRACIGSGSVRASAETRTVWASLGNVATPSNGPRGKSWKRCQDRYGLHRQRTRADRGADLRHPMLVCCSLGANGNGGSQTQRSGAGHLALDDAAVQPHVVRAAAGTKRPHLSKWGHVVG